MSRFLAAAAAAAALVLAGSVPDAPASVRVSRATVSGPVVISVALKDVNGRPVPGALVELRLKVRFFGKREALMDSVRTGRTGVARLRFSPAERGVYTGTISFPGAAVFGATETPISINVKDPPRTYEQEPLGVGGPWARSWMILVPVAAIWGVFGLALWHVWCIGVASRRPNVVDAHILNEMPTAELALPALAVSGNGKTHPKIRQGRTRRGGER